MKQRVKASAVVHTNNICSVDILLIPALTTGIIPASLLLWLILLMLLRMHSTRSQPSPHQRPRLLGLPGPVVCECIDWFPQQQILRPAVVVHLSGGIRQNKEALVTTWHVLQVCFYTAAHSSSSVLKRTFEMSGTQFVTRRQADSHTVATR